MDVDKIVSDLRKNYIFSIRVTEIPTSINSHELLRRVQVNEKLSQILEALEEVQLLRYNCILKKQLIYHIRTYLNSQNSKLHNTIVIFFLAFFG